VVEAPVVEAPVVEAPVVEAPVVEAPAEVPAAPSVEAPVVEVEAETAEEKDEEVEVQEDEPEEAAAEGITIMQDMEVYDHQARSVGSVAQVGVDQSLSPVLLIRSDDGEISVVPWSRISTIGHIILLEEEKAPAAPQAAPEPVAEPEPEPQKSDGCPACGVANSPVSKFCEECGNNLG
ncbi:MAG: hypothetical protein J4G04_08725, partial [Nitrosopumilaceae archaeon]|nr:hypothetical protein [Nitrosopumilaceae archaeon]